MTENPDLDLSRLAALARQRRADLGLPLNDAIAKAAEVSKGTVQRVEKAMPIRETNYVKIDRMLDWAPGSCMAILRGGNPVTVEESNDSPGVQKSSAPQDVIDREARETVQLALIATAKGTTAEEIRDMSERIVQDLRERGII